MLFCCLTARWIAKRSRVNWRGLLLLGGLFVGGRLAQMTGLDTAGLVHKRLGDLCAVQAAPGFYR